MKTALIFAHLALLFGGTLFSQELKHLKLDSSFGSFVEDDFPFFTQTLDCRKLGEPWPKDNLTPRGIILKLGGGYHAAFDIDLLRVALIWKENGRGEYLAMSGMAPGSYRLPNKKADAGQENLPTPLGTPIAANGLYPGWGKKRAARDRDGADAGEPGLGPAMGMKWIGIEVDSDRGVFHGWTLRYEVGGTSIAETWDGPERSVRIGPHQEELTIHWSDALSQRIPPSVSEEIVSISYASPEGKRKRVEPGTPFNAKLTTTLSKTTLDHGFRIEEVGLPLPNPWKRNVRLSAFAFFKNGDAAVATFDGDVWLVSGLSGALNSITWRRFASGLHEPIGLEIVEDRIYVFTRNGIVRPLDRTNDGVADFYENFSSVVPQTAETREFANDIIAKPGGGFYLAKGGQVSSTKGVANGTVVEVSPDGRSYDIVCTGLRMPYIGVDPETGMITASDQQGHWKPATPIHVIQRGAYYGFQPAKLKDKAVHPAPIVEPEIWIPHFVNQSGASQVWLRHANMGALNDSLIHIGYNRPEIFKVYFERDGDRIIQGAVASITHQFPSGLLKGKVHPLDGSLWLTGFKIWGTSAEQISGLYRVTPTGEPVWVPTELRSEKRGVLLSFSQEVDPAIAGNPASYSVDRWNYLRSHNYGSGHYKLNGEPGQQSLSVASIKLSNDRKRVFLGIPDMRPSHSLRVTYKVPDLAGTRVANAFFTVHDLREMDLAGIGFKENQVDLKLSPDMPARVKEITPTAELGRQTATTYGCVACHAAGENVPVATAFTGDARVVVGPPWNGLWKSSRKFSDGTDLKSVDEVYLRESILDPARKVAVGFETEKTGAGMPSYLGVLKDHEIESVILYIKSLRQVKPKRN